MRLWNFGLALALLLPIPALADEVSSFTLEIGRAHV